MSKMNDEIPCNDPGDDIHIDVTNVRHSIHEIKSRLDTTVKEGLNEESDEKHWNLSYLKKMFKSEEVEELYGMYIQRLHQVFFSLLMLLQMGLFLSHSIILKSFSENMSTNSLEFVIYVSVVGISVIIFALTNGCFNISIGQTSLKLLSFIFFILLHIVNSLIPFYYNYSVDSHLRPAYTSHIIICCYCFFFIADIIITICSGIMTMCIHIVILICFTYDDLPASELTEKVLSDSIYLICLNGLGVYYRYMNEIVTRKSFLDKRACIMSNRYLQFQKKEEEHLMETIIPSYVVDTVRKNFLQCWEKKNYTLEMTPFEYKTSFTQIFENVTILFADVVNYTEMTEKLDITQLLETLNELFGNFDVASERLNVLRIKFLGDCYYCVSGLPPNYPNNHAEACVDLGLEMIRIISDIGKTRAVNVNMRIGIHTGKIISGIIGNQKIQFDIWSRDVSLANQMETDGEAGKVHITEQTKKLLKKFYTMKVTSKGTYLVSPEVQGNLTEKNERGNNYIKNRCSTSNYMSSSKKTPKIQKYDKSIHVLRDREDNHDEKVQSYNIIETSKTVDLMSSISDVYSYKITKEIIEPRESQRRTAFMNNNIKMYKEMMKESYEEIQDAIANLYLTKYQQWFKVREINPITLSFRDCSQEYGFFRKWDPLFKYYLISEVFLLIFLFVIQNLTSRAWNWQTWYIYLTLIVLIFVFLPLMWIYNFWKKRKHWILILLTNWSKNATESVWVRHAIYTIICILFTICVFSELINCKYYDDEINPPFNGTQRSIESFLLLVTEHGRKKVCSVPWHMTQTCSLAIIMSFLFLRICMWVKFAYAAIITIIYSLCIWNFTEDLNDTNNETFNNNISSRISHILSVTFLTVTLHVIDRQNEYMNRLDFLWSENLKEEQSKIKSKYIINKMLLNNVLPEHLTEMYLNIKRPPAALYHEKYENAAVMFASVVGYKKDDIEDDILLTIMAEIIGGFDRLILTKGFGKKIEKIKVAKWTYMAASGISPGYGETKLNQNDPCEQLHILLKFAAAMICQLNVLSVHYSQNFELRIGISNGEIVAGVVGSKKPLYDIWGTPVNMAARMDTTGEPNKIHVMENSVSTIERLGYTCTPRGNISVKGLKLPVPTYFVNLDQNFDLVKRDSSLKPS